MNNNKQIIIIGAGASGLACCSKLLEKGFTNVLILEASDISGGRLRKLPKEKNFADFDIELGGEEVHGENTEYYQMALNNGAELFNYWTEHEFYINYSNNFGRLEELLKIHKELKEVWELFEEGIYNPEEQFPDVTLREYLVSKNIPQQAFFLANTMIGVEAGTDLDKVSIKGFSDLCRSWKAGANNFLLRNKSHIDIIRKEFNNALEKIQFNTEIKKIDYTEDKLIKLQDSNSKDYECDLCVITIPITQLKKLQFSPKLPDNVDKAISTLSMDNCAKVILKFKDCIWPANSNWILIPGLVPLYWSTIQGKDSKCNIITGMTAGENCRTLNKMYKHNKEEFIHLVLSELEIGLNLTDLRHCLVDFIWMDWADEKFIEGGYTYPCVNEGDARANLRNFSNENKSRIFFAGEATAENGHIGTIHGAIESGYRVASIIQ